MRNADNPGGAGRLVEIVGVLKKHGVIRGMTPVKLRETVEDLGPTYVKLGQMLSMRPDLLPAAYCEELQKLRSEVAPMPFDEVERVVEASLGMKLNEAFPPSTPRPSAARPSRRRTPPYCPPANPWWSRCSARAFTPSWRATSPCCARQPGFLSLRPRAKPWISPWCSTKCGPSPSRRWIF
jgi:hypothetical protein